MAKCAHPLGKQSRTSAAQTLRAPATWPHCLSLPSCPAAQRKPRLAHEHPQHSAGVTVAACPGAGAVDGGRYGCRHRHAPTGGPLACAEAARARAWVIACARHDVVLWVPRGNSDGNGDVIAPTPTPHMPRHPFAVSPPTFAPQSFAPEPLRETFRTRFRRFRFRGSFAYRAEPWK